MIFRFRLEIFFFKKENIERNEKRKKEKEYLPRQHKKLIFDMGAEDFGIEFLKFVGFLCNVETSHAIGGSYQ